MKRTILALIILVLAVGAIIYRAAPSAEQEYALNDIAFYVMQLTSQQNNSFAPGYFFFAYSLQHLVGLDPVDTVRVTKLVFVFSLLFFFLIVRALSRNTPVALLASLLFVFNAYSFNLATEALRQMFAGVFTLGAIWMFLQAQNAPGGHSRNRLFFACAGILLFIGVGVIHEITFLVLAASLFVFLFFSWASTTWAENKPAYLLGFIVLSFVFLRAFVWLIDQVLPFYFSYSRTVYGLDMLVSTMTPTKLGLITLFMLGIAAYSLLAYWRDSARAVFQQKLVYCIGMLALTLLVFPVGWTTPALVYGLGFYFVFYFFYGLLNRKPRAEELAVAAWFVAAAFLSRNLVLSLDFFMYRFESELTAPFLLLVALGLKEFFLDLHQGWIKLPVASSLNAFNADYARKIVVLGIGVLAVTANLWIMQGIMSYPDAENGQLPIIIGTPYFKSLKSDSLVGTDEIVRLYQVVGKKLYRMTPFWAGKLDKAIGDLRSKGVEFAVVAGPEGSRIINSGETAQFMTRTYSNLRNANFDQTFDSGVVHVYRFNFDAAYYYSADGAIIRSGG